MTQTETEILTLSRRSALRALALSGTAFALALGGCATPMGVSPSRIEAHTSMSPIAAQPGTLRRTYVDGPHGQVGVLSITPRASRLKQTTPLLMLHPTAVSSDYYRDFMMDMGRDRVVIGLDMPGYGRSTAPQSPLSMAELAEATGAAIDAMGLTNVDVMGYHTGAYLGAELAVQRPGLVRKLVLPGIPYYEGQERADALKNYGTITPATDSVEPVTKKWGFWVDGRGPGVTLEQGISHFYDEMQSGSRSNWAYNAVFSYAAETRFPLINQPTLIPNSHGSLKDQSRDAAALIPGATVLELPNMDKGIFDVNVPELAALTRDFLDE